MRQGVPTFGCEERLSAQINLLLCLREKHTTAVKLSRTDSPEVLQVGEAAALPGVLPSRSGQTASHVSPQTCVQQREKKNHRRG